MFYSTLFNISNAQGNFYKSHNIIHSILYTSHDHFLEGEGKLIFNMEDWNASTFNLTIKSGTSESSKHSIIILSNNRYEGNKKFYLEILQIATPPSLKGCVVKGNPSRLPVVVQDDDSKC